MFKFYIGVGVFTLGALICAALTWYHAKKNWELHGVIMGILGLIVVIPIIIMMEIEKIEKNKICIERGIIEEIKEHSNQIKIIFDDKREFIISGVISGVIFEKGKMSVIYWHCGNNADGKIIAAKTEE